MKTLHIAFWVIVVSVLVSCAHAGTLPAVSVEKHMAAIKGELLNLEVPGDSTRIGVLPIKGDDGTLVRDKLEIVFRNSGKFEIIARDELAPLINEIEFQEGAEVDGKTVKELKLKGVDYLLTGSVTVRSEGAGTAVSLNVKLTNCSSGGRKYGYNNEVLVSLDDDLGRYTKTMGPVSIIIAGFILLIILLVIFRIFGGAKKAAAGTIFATVNDFLLSDKKIRESTGDELKQMKNKVRDIAAKADQESRTEISTAANEVAGEIDLLSQKVSGAPFGQDMQKGRAIPRDVAERLKGADLAFTDRVNDLRQKIIRTLELATEKRFEGLDSDVTKLKTETAELIDKFEERGRILRSF